MRIPLRYFHTISMKALSIRAKRLKQLNVHKQNNNKKKVDTERRSTTQYLKENFDTCHNMNESYAK